MRQYGVIEFEEASQLDNFLASYFDVIALSGYFDWRPFDGRRTFVWRN